MGPLPPHHIAIVVAELGRAEAFYAGVLGLPVLRRWDDAAGAPRSVWLALGQHSFLALERATEPGPTRVDGAPGLHCLALGISPEARVSVRERLAAAGVPIERESPFTLYVRDPDGVLVGLSHYPDASPEEPRNPA